MCGLRMQRSGKRADSVFDEHGREAIYRGDLRYRIAAEDRFVQFVVRKQQISGPAVGLDFKTICDEQRFGVKKNAVIPAVQHGMAQLMRAYEARRGRAERVGNVYNVRTLDELVKAAHAGQRNAQNDKAQLFCKQKGVVRPVLF